jgi:hypothetical protein
MKVLAAISAVVISAGIVFSVVSQPKPLATRIGNAPVVVELFTSQGCSSCPPADELLGRLAGDPALHGRIIPLAFHVDYWDHLGWRDPFSSAQWSQRQYDYVRRFGITGPYTPQAVVNGAREMVGSDQAKVFAAIEAESRRAPAATIAIHGDSVTIDAPRALDLIVAAVIDPQSTKVVRGENEGRTLASYGVVRKLTRMGAVSGRVTRKVPGGRVVVLLQDAKTLRIEAAVTSF